MASSTDKIIELNVGGVHYATFLSTLRSDANSLLAKFFPEADGPTTSVSTLQQDAAGRYFIDRDGVLFRFVLDFLRNRRLVMPESFQERRRLRQEADYYQLADLILHLTTCPTTPPPPPALGGMTTNNSSADISSTVVDSNTGDPASQDDKYSGYITVGYRGTFAAGREGMADVRFRKLTRILICGRVALCRQVFGDSLNESRDPDRGSLSRYTSRFFLKHTSLEQAFEDLGEAGFTLVACCASGTSGASGDTKPGTDSEENRWNHYNEFIFSRY